MRGRSRAQGGLTHQSFCSVLMASSVKSALDCAYAHKYKYTIFFTTRSRVLHARIMSLNKRETSMPAVRLWRRGEYCVSGMLGSHVVASFMIRAPQPSDSHQQSCRLHREGHSSGRDRQGRQRVRGLGKCGSQ